MDDAVLATLHQGIMGLASWMLRLSNFPLAMMDVDEEESVDGKDSDWFSGGGRETQCTQVLFCLVQLLGASVVTCRAAPFLLEGRRPIFRHWRWRRTAEFVTSTSFALS